MKKRFVTKVFLFFIFFLPLKAANIAFINIETIMNKSIAGIYINQKIVTLQKNSNNFILNAENDLRKKEADLVSKKNILNEDNYKIEVSKLKKEISNFNIMKNKEIQKFKKKKNNYTLKLLASIKPILSDYSKSKNISILLQKKNIILGANELDITNDVLQLINKKIKEINIE